MKNTYIGDNSIIGANTTVAGKIPANSIYRNGAVLGGGNMGKTKIPLFFSYAGFV